MSGLRMGQNIHSGCCNMGHESEILAPTVKINNTSGDKVTSYKLTKRSALDRGPHFFLVKILFKIFLSKKQLLEKTRND